MNANECQCLESDVLFKEEVYEICGCAMDVHNTVGHGFREKSYERGLIVEFGIREIPYQQQAQFPVLYKAVGIEKFIPDLIVFEKIIVDTKVIDGNTDRERGQMLNYLKITSLEVGLLINFAKPRLEWERIVRSKARHPKL